MKSNSNSLIIAILFSLLLNGHNVSGQGIWTRQNSGTSADLYGVYFLNDNKGYVVGDSGVFLQTKDNGINWSKQTLGNYVLRAVQFIDSSNGYVVGYGSYGGVILKTTDGGNNWDTTTTNGLCLALHFMNKDTGIVVGYGRLIIKTSDGGQSWLDLAYNVGTSRFINDICFVNDSIGYFASADCGIGFNCPDLIDYLAQIGKTTDGGDNWKISSTFGIFYSVSFCSESVGFVTGLKTTDGGNKWKRSSVPYGYGLFFVSPDTGWSVGQTGDDIHGIVAVTTNGGNKWINEYSVSTGTLYHVFFSSKNYGWAVGASGTILKYTGNDSLQSEPKSKRINIYPNPFNETGTNISFGLQHPQEVCIQIHNSLGQKIQTFYEGLLNKGDKKLFWNPKGIASGVYIISVRCAEFNEALKCIYIHH